MATHLMAAGRRVIAPFLRGLHPATVGDLTYADGLTLAADAAAVAAAVSAMTGSPDGVDMIGHDIGAGIVQRVAAAWPERVRGAVTMAVPPPTMFAALFADPAQLQRSFYIWLFQIDGLAETILERDRRLIDYLWDVWSPGLGDFWHREVVRTLYGDQKFIRNALRIYRANIDTRLHDPALSSLAQRTEVTADNPLMLLGGADDGCIHPRFLRDAHSCLAPGSRIEILETLATSSILSVRRPSRGLHCSGSRPTKGIVRPNGATGPSAELPWHTIPLVEFVEVPNELQGAKELCAHDQQHYHDSDDGNEHEAHPHQRGLARQQL
jgi:pimeloyl-ACP methyl ester carboxylesterase